MTYPLEHLLPPDILQPAIQIPNFLYHLINLSLIRAFNLARFSNRNIQCKLNATPRLAVAQPTAARRHILGREAELMLARVRRREGETAF